jgi:hypothetical protein
VAAAINESAELPDYEGCKLGGSLNRHNGYVVELGTFHEHAQVF